MKKIFIASDHAGYNLKKNIINHFSKKNNFYGGHGIVGAQVPIPGIDPEALRQTMDSLSDTFFGLYNRFIIFF